MSATTATSAPNKKPAKKASWVVRIVLIVVVLLAVGFAGFIMVAAFGRVSGLEFSPDNFTIRSYRYHQIPLIGMQVSKVTYTGVSSNLLDDLKLNSWIPSPPVGPITWHQAMRQQGGGQPWEGDPMILINYLGRPDMFLGATFVVPSSRESDHWVEWNADHPDLAAILWPEIVELARLELYNYVPETLALAESAEEPGAFQADLDAYLAETYTFVGTTRFELGEYAAALAAFDAALQRAPESPEALRGRAEAQAAAGQGEHDASAQETLEDSTEETAEPLESASP